MKRKHVSENSPPDRWIKCPRKGDQLIADLFLPTKTFLDEKFDDKLEKMYFFKPSMIKNIEDSLKIKIGIVIDLNNSSRYYNSSALSDLKIQYVKIKCTGHDGAPTDDQVNEFIETIKKFTSKYPDDKIIVHCTHGFNRTGYMIISYLVTDQGWDLIPALTIFAESRPPGIYKQEYIDKLIAKYDPDQKYPAPPYPTWFEEDKLPDSNISITRFPLDDPKIKLVDPEKATQIKEEIKDFFNFSYNSFPAVQPVSLSHENLVFLKKENYFVSWKADGTRFMMYIRDKNEVYMIDRLFNIFHIPHLSFPHKDGGDKHVFITFLDGEFVFENDGEFKRPRFLVFDIMFLNNIKLDTRFSNRMRIIKEDIIAPRDKAFAKGLLKRENEAFSVRFKVFFPKTKTKELYEKYMKNITHETDGLMFHPDKIGFQTGVSKYYLKWKPENLNSVDFYLDIVKIVRPACLDEYEGHLYTLGQQEIFAKIMVDDELKKYNKKIIECSFDKSIKRWKFLRVRDDKTAPNAINTARNVCQTIENPVTIDDIYNAVNFSENSKNNIEDSDKKQNNLQ